MGYFFATSKILIYYTAGRNLGNHWFFVQSYVDSELCSARGSLRVFLCKGQNNVHDLLRTEFQFHVPLYKKFTTPNFLPALYPRNCDLIIHFYNFALFDWLLFKEIVVKVCIACWIDFASIGPFILIRTRGNVFDIYRNPFLDEHIEHQIGGRRRNSNLW